MQITKQSIGEVDNKEVVEYTLSNSQGYSLSVMTYGAIITKIMMPDKNGDFENITVNVETLEEIVSSRPFHGAIIGPVSGRISGASYQDGEKETHLDKNENSNNLHSGFTGIDQHVWEASTEKSEYQTSLILETVRPDGEGNFPGDLKVAVTYTLNEANEIEIAYKAETNKRTLFNPTNHVYFNLNGNANDLIYNHTLQVNSEKFAVLDDDNIPTGELKEVEGTDFDLRQLRKLEEVLKSNEEQIENRDGYDHPFVLKKEANQRAAVLKEEHSGRVLKMKTDADAVVIFSHNSEKVPATKGEKVLPVHAGLTLETCALPDAVNQKDFGSIWLKPGETFKSATIFALEVE